MATRKKATPRKEQMEMVDALEIVLERADWVTDRIHTFLEDEYDINDAVGSWIEEELAEALHIWLDEKYDDEGPDGSTFEKVVRDAVQVAVKKYMTDGIMLMLLDEVRANMGKLLGRAVKDYMDSINNVDTGESND